MKQTSFFFTVILLFCSQVIFAQGWVQQNSGTMRHLNDSYFFDNNIGIVAGDSGKVLRTVNGGATWTTQTTNTPRRLTSISVVGSNYGWISGGDYVTGPVNLTYNIILRTTNGGNNWQKIDTGLGFNSDLHTSICFIDMNTGFITKAQSTGFWTYGRLLKTTNGGLNWQEVSGVPSLAYQKTRFVNATTGYLLGSYGNDVGQDTSYIFKTTNSGVNWTRVYFYSHRRFTDIRCSGNNVWLCGRDNNSTQIILYSTDSGYNWTSKTVPSTYNLRSTYFTSQSEGFIVGVLGSIYKTSDLGNNWNQQPSGVGGWLNSVFFVNSMTGWSVGDYGTILKTNTGGVNGIKKLSNEIPEKFTLFQNYPNPFNPTTKLQFQIAKQSKAKITIYDVLGKEIETLLNETLLPGTYEIEWSAVGGVNNFASGVYFYALVTSDYSETKKMVLVK